MRASAFKGFLLLIVVCLSSSLCSASKNIRTMVVFGDSLSDTGNTTHLLKSLRFEDNPAFLVRPFKLFVIHRMEDYAQDYHVPNALLNAGVAMVEDFFDGELAPMLAKLISKVRIVPVLPGEPYWNNRFTNGRVWAEYLAPMLSINREDPRQFDVQAFGGGWAVTYDYQLTTWNLIRHPLATLKTLVVGKLIPPSLGLSVQAWLLMHDRASADDLIFIFAGSNDYLNVLTFEDNYHPAQMSKYIDNVLNGIEYSVLKLIQNGAKQLVIVNLPDLSVSPRIIHSSDELVLASAVKLHNQRLQRRIQDWQHLYPDVTFIPVDVPKLMNTLLRNPESYGFTNTEQACINVKLPMYRLLATPFQHNPALDLAQVLNYHHAERPYSEKNYQRCANDAQYMFWDEIHPSTRVHQSFAVNLCTILAKNGYQTDCTLHV